MQLPRSSLEAVIPIPAALRTERVLVMELAGLGDNVHLLPALWLVRRQWPHARLDVMVNSHAAGLFELTPWVDRVWAYPSAPKPRLHENLAWIRRLRRERFDCIINTTGADRSSLLAFASGAPVRIGRRPADGGPPGWRWLYTSVVENPFYREPMYWQKWRCLRQAGIGAATDIAGSAPQFHVTIDPALRRAAGIAFEDERRYIHISPFTTSSARELAGEQIAALIARLREAHPELDIAVSCADTQRERAKLDALLSLLPQRPWKVFPGALGVAGVAAVIEKAALNLSGDSGALHLAMMTRAPALAWFRAHRGQDEWIPEGPHYRVLIAAGGARNALHGIATEALLAAAQEILS
jgi:ADP-heptose:LPS heptosyltransferase